MKELYERLNWAFGGVDIRQLKKADDDAYRELLLQKADFLFSDGRCGVNPTEGLEIYRDPEAETALHDLTQIQELTDAERQKLAFYMDLKDFCFPFFCKDPVDLTRNPFCFINPRFNITNGELRDFLYDTPYVHLAAIICEGLIEAYWRNRELKDTVVLNKLSDYLFHGFKHSEKDPEVLREHLDQLINIIFTAENHLEVGHRLGLTPQAQAIYDMTDTFICKEYLFNQVDFAKEMDLWLQKNAEAEPDDEYFDLLMEELEACAQRHEIIFVDKEATLIYLYIDLLQIHLHAPSDEDDLEWEDDF